ncbi:hypothetical protein AXX12_07565 [Anaerosporomusa subterranea]|uniref:Uncharacterized protein n=1 Tax=Anaerosporomusa subterranea TaxID=1794912 RepID=A0A154BRZ5_ANASB|nr:hypothetical protein [Anaerosporomusa subterranea]KYZ76288.1 hypothetical protein AXX12_07565 [Anaerosporomusa subterranea]
MRPLMNLMPNSSTASLGSLVDPAATRTKGYASNGSAWHCATLGALAPFTALGRPWPSRYLDVLSNGVGGIPLAGANADGALSTACI